MKGKDELDRSKSELSVLKGSIKPDQSQTKTFILRTEDNFYNQDKFYYQYQENINVRTIMSPK